MDLAGIYAAIPTPFSESEQIDFERFESNLNYWLSQPLAGPVVLGTAGEAVYITKEERKAIWTFCEGHVHRSGKRFIVGAGAETTRETISYIHLAQDLGADAALVLTPSFFRPSQDALIEHYNDVAANSSIPILLYSYPAFTGVDLSADTVIRLAENPKILGIKDSSASISKLAKIKSHCPDFQVFTGIASTLYSFLCLGASGAIAALASIAAGHLSEIQKAFESNHHDQARRLQLSIAPISETIELQYGIPALKYAMDRIGLYGGPLRRPLAPLNQKGRAEIDRLLEEFLSVSRQ